MFLISRVTHQLYVYYNSKILQKCCSSFTTDTPGSGISANTLKYLPVTGRITVHSRRVVLQPTDKGIGWLPGLNFGLGADAIPDRSDQG